MAYQGLKSFINLLEKEQELIRIKDYVNPVLEITEITDRVSKLPGGGKALLFENTGTRFPLLINALGSEKRMAMAFGRDDLKSIEDEIMALFQKLTMPKGNLWNKLRMLPQLKEVSSWMPGKGRGKGKCQEVVMDTPDLDQLPILKCWPADGGRFITLPAVHTVDPETGAPNVGMYRMQVFEKNMTGMHWHPHKTGAVHFAKYQALGRKMPVTVTLGGDPAYIYAATAPLPENMDEYLLAGFLRKRQVRLVKCLTNDLHIPEDVDFVLEGYVDPGEALIWEGPFGDHTGFYSLANYFPRFHITCITHRKDAVYPATIVGIPPMEDAWIGKATERIFLSPIRLTMIPELTDMDIPFAGVAHNISIVKIKKTYPGQAVKVMHSLWGAGQMMFNKILIVVDESSKHGAWSTGRGARGNEHGVLNDLSERSDVSDVDANKSQTNNQQENSLQAPVTNHQLQIASSQLHEIPVDIHDYDAFAKIFAGNFNPLYSLHFSRGPLDILDHSSRNYAFGSKLGIDLTRPFAEEINGNTTETGETTLSDIEIKVDIPCVTGFKSLVPEFSLPVLLLTVRKNEEYNKADLEKELSKIHRMDRFKAVLFFNDGADLDDVFSLMWLLGGNLEPERDISLMKSGSSGNGCVLVDATFKTRQHDHFRREWPNIVTMDEVTITSIDQKWTELRLGDFQPSPSLKYKPMVMGAGATYTS